VTSRRSAPWSRISTFVALTVVAVSGGSLYVVNAVNRLDAPATAPVTPFIAVPADPDPAPAVDRGTGPASERPQPRAPAPPITRQTEPPAPRSAGRRPAAVAPTSTRMPEIMIRITALGDTHGRLGQARLAEPPVALTGTPLRCERLHFAGGRGVCLTAERRMFASYGAILFDAGFVAGHQLPLGGVPSRVRVAPDGRHAAITVFVAGHSYAASNFSTRTTVVDLRTGGVVVDDMEAFTIWSDGARFHAADFNFWGVTFARDGNRLYATLGTGGQTYLVEGNLERREATVMWAGIECPSLSPDNTRIAFKKRTGGLLTAVTWRLSVLDLASGREWELSEPRSVDDQVEWLDDRLVLYGLPAAASGTAVTNVWTVPADGSGSPQLLVPGAESPAVVRQAS
jgi:hypothetical protein